MILNYQFVNSSMLASANYDTETHDMSVTFKNGRDYVYEDVKQSTYELLIGAASPGAYFNSIKNGLVIKI